MSLVNQFNLLLTLGRLDEGRQIAPRFTGSWGLRAPLLIAMAAGQWSTAESLASALRTNPAAFENHRREAEWILAAAQASSGRVTVAGATLRAAQSQAEMANQTPVANLARWGRLMLALFSHGVATSPGDPGRGDSTTFGLVTRAAWSAAAGDTASASRLLATVRSRSAPDIARQAFAPAIVGALIDARAGRWPEVVQDLGPAALQGRPRGYAEFNSAPLLRWLVADAYEHLGQPDSAAAWFERAIAPPPDGGRDFADIRMASSFGHRRLVLLYARMGRLDEARRHWEIFSREFARPDPEMRPLVAEARDALASARGLATSTKR